MQLELALKQPLRISPSLVRREYHHLSYATPFLDEELSSFFFSLPNHQETAWVLRDFHLKIAAKTTVRSDPSRLFVFEGGG